MKTLDNIIFYLEMFVIGTPIWSLLGAILQLNDVFIFIKPFPSYTLDANYQWQPPVAFPSVTTYSVDGVDKAYQISWSEDLLTWRGLKDSTDWNNEIFKWNAETSQWEVIT